MPPLQTIKFITGNPDKLREAKAILGPFIDLRSQSIEIHEIQGSIEEIAKDKCRKASLAINGPVLTEDTSLEFTALKGLPGPYIKWFLEALGHDGLNKLVEAYEDKSVEAICTFALSSGPGAEPVIFQGRTIGKIVPPRGTSTVFANKSWDPIFEFEGKTYAEMGREEKNKISHYFKALGMLKQWLVEHQG